MIFIYEIMTHKITACLEPSYLFNSTMSIQSAKLLIVDNYVANKSDLQNVINQMMLRIQTQFNIPPCTYVVNVVSDSKGKLFGFSYVWFDDERVANLISGKEANGMERYRRMETILPPEIEYPEPQTKDELIKQCQDWGLDDILSEKSKPRTVVKYERLPSHILCPYICLTEQQQADYLRTQKERVEMLNFNFSRVNICEDEEEYDSNGNQLDTSRLVASPIPYDMTAQDLSILLSRYSSVVGYPKVSITTKPAFISKSGKPIPKTNVATVLFDPTTKDAILALTMITRLNVTSRGRDHVIYFSHPIKNK